MFENANVLWVVHIGNDDRIALRAREESFICIGWTAMGNLAGYTTREAMREAMKKAYPDWSEGSINSSWSQVFKFAHVMKVGEPVVFPIRPTREIAIGEIVGQYRWAADDKDLLEHDYCNVLKVKWLKIVPRMVFSKSALHSFGSFTSVSTSNDHLEEVLAVLKGETPGTAAGKPIGPKSAAPALVDPPVATEPGESTYDTAVQETEDYLLKAWVSTTQEFEKVVAGVFEAMGYTATVQQGTHDHGVDVIAHPDPLGIQPPFIKIQVKSGSGTVGAPMIKQLKGAMNQGDKGVVICLGSYSSDARLLMQNTSDLVLIDGPRFVKLFLDHYDKLAPEWKTKFPLKRVYVPQA